MAEQLANLQRNEHIQIFDFDVTNLSVSLVWGNIYYNNVTFDTGITLTNKKIFVSYIPSDNYIAICASRIQDNTKIVVQLSRGTTATINGKVYVMIID